MKGPWWGLHSNENALMPMGQMPTNGENGKLYVVYKSAVRKQEHMHTYNLLVSDYQKKKSYIGV